MTVTLTLHPASKTDAMRLERPRFVDEVPLFRDGQLVQILTDEEYRAAHR